VSRFNLLNLNVIAEDLSRVIPGYDGSPEVNFSKLFESGTFTGSRVNRHRQSTERLLKNDHSTRASLLLGSFDLMISRKVQIRFS